MKKSGADKKASGPLKEVFRQKLEGYHAQPTDRLWERLELTLDKQQLARERKATRRYMFLAAAALLLLVSVGSLFVFRNLQKPAPEMSVLQQPPQQQNANRNAQTGPESAAPAAAAAPEKPATAASEEPAAPAAAPAAAAPGAAAPAATQGQPKPAADEKAPDAAPAAKAPTPDAGTRSRASAPKAAAPAGQSKSTSARPAAKAPAPATRPSKASGTAPAPQIKQPVQLQPKPDAGAAIALAPPVNRPAPVKNPAASKPAVTDQPSSPEQPSAPEPAASRQEPPQAREQVQNGQNGQEPRLNTSAPAQPEAQEKQPVAATPEPVPAAQEPVAAVTAPVKTDSAAPAPAATGTNTKNTKVVTEMKVPTWSFGVQAMPTWFHQNIKLSNPANSPVLHSSGGMQEPAQEHEEYTAPVMSVQAGLMVAKHLSPNLRLETGFIYSDLEVETRASYFRNDTPPPPIGIALTTPAPELMPYLPATLESSSPLDSAVVKRTSMHMLRYRYRQTGVPLMLQAQARKGRWVLFGGMGLQVTRLTQMQVLTDSEEIKGTTYTRDSGTPFRTWNTYGLASAGIGYRVLPRLQVRANANYSRAFSPMLKEKELHGVRQRAPYMVGFTAGLWFDLFKTVVSD